MSENVEKLKQAVDLYERMKKRIAGRLHDREIHQFVMLFLTAMEEMEKMRKDQ